MSPYQLLSFERTGVLSPSLHACPRLPQSHSSCLTPEWRCFCCHLSCHILPYRRQESQYSASNFLDMTVWTVGFFPDCGIAPAKVGCLTVTSFAGHVLTEVHAARPSFKKTFSPENLFTFIITGGVAKPASFPSESRLCQCFMRCLFIVNNCSRPRWEPSSTNLIQHG